VSVTATGLRQSALAKHQNHSIEVWTRPVEVKRSFHNQETRALIKIAVAAHNRELRCSSSSRSSAEGVEYHASLRTRLAGGGRGRAGSCARLCLDQKRTSRIRSF